MNQEPHWLVQGIVLAVCITILGYALASAV